MLSSQKGLTMPTTSLSINGVPYTDTKNFLAEFNRVIARDTDNIESILLDWAELEEAGTDEYERFAFATPVRSDKVYFCCRNRCDSGNHKSQFKPFVAKRKEVK
jgi:hypothetical protein